jgi:uncharacterized protein (DUF1684 family)
MKRTLTLSFLALLLVVFAIAATPAPSSHVAEIEKYRVDRIARLTRPDGWLSLIGLEWLAPGRTTFGSARSNAILLPSGPAVAGAFELKDGVVTLAPIDGVMVNGKPAQRMILDIDTTGHPTIVQVGSSTMQIIARGKRIGVRMKDPNAPTRQKFKGLDFYPIRSAYRVEARVIPYNPPHSLSILNVLGMTEPMTAPAAIEFTLKGKKYRLDPVLEEGEDDWFVIFGDQTNGKTTYGAGRYLYVSKPDKNGRTVIDFNKAYNPPCSFTGYATCPLPPKQNKLAVKIEAGEKKYAGGH